GRVDFVVLAGTHRNDDARLGVASERRDLTHLRCYGLALLDSVRAVTSPLRVAVLAPISWRVPPRHYGPWELFASLLTEGLVERGLDVTLFATGDSITKARLVGSSPCGYSENAALDAKVWECLH